MPTVLVPSAGHRALCLQRRVLHCDTSIDNVLGALVKVSYIRDILDASYQWVKNLTLRTPLTLFVCRSRVPSCLTIDVDTIPRSGASVEDDDTDALNLVRTVSLSIWTRLLLSF